MTEKLVKTIEIDCPPGYPRPDDLIGDVVKGTPLESVLQEPVGKFFGNYTWDFEHVSDEQFLEANEVVATRLKALYNDGTVRYASW